VRLLIESAILFFLALLLVNTVFAVNITDYVTLDSNTYRCGGEVLCEAWLSVDAPGNTQINSTNFNLTLTTLDGKDSGVTVEYQILHLANVTVSRVEQQCQDGNVSCVDNIVEYNMTGWVPSDSIVSGKNKIHLWTNSKQPMTVDWNFKITKLKAHKTNPIYVDLDTRDAGWAVWEIGDASTNPFDYIFFDDMENTSAHSTNWVSTVTGRNNYRNDQAKNGSWSLRINSSSGGASNDNYVANNKLNSTSFTGAFCVDFWYRYDTLPTASNLEQSVYFNSWLVNGYHMASDVMANDNIHFFNSTGVQWYAIKSASPINSWNYTRFCTGTGYAASGFTNVTFYDLTGQIYYSGWDRNVFTRLLFITRMNGASMWIDNLRVWNASKYGHTPPPLPDPCVYSGSGTWNWRGNCTLNTSTDLLGNSIVYTAQTFERERYIINTTIYNVSSLSFVGNTTITILPGKSLAVRKIK
jgi:hypothetical protein